MYNGDCYPNGSYIYDELINQNRNSGRFLMCVLPNTALTTGEWSGPTGSVNCTNSSNSDPLRCNITTSPNATLDLYVAYGQASTLLPAQDGFYSCCLPTSCSDPNTNIITANILSKLSHCTHTLSFDLLYIGWAQIADIRVDLPSNVTILPQQYTLHAIRTVAITFTNAADWYYESGTDSTELTSSSCSGQSGYSCTIGNGVTVHSSNGTIDYTLTVTWNGENITSGVFSRSNNNGDHVYRVNLNVGRSDLQPVNRNRYHTVTGE